MCSVLTIIDPCSRISYCLFIKKVYAIVNFNHASQDLNIIKPHNFKHHKPILISSNSHFTARNEVKVETDIGTILDYGKVIHLTL